MPMFFVNCAVCLPWISC